MSAQDVTLQQYQQWMKINATAHLLRTARQVGIFAELRQGQRTWPQLCDAQSLAPEPTRQLLDALVAIGIVEKYADDYALSRAAHLLCQYDEDLGDRHWQRLNGAVDGTQQRHEIDDEHYFDQLAATQWIHTPAAIEAAEILDVGGESQPTGISILDLGCGSAVWSCALAHRDPAATVTAVDQPPALAAARRTADSIELGARFRTVEQTPHQYRAEAAEFDLVIVAQRLNCLSDDEAADLLGRATGACKPGGRVVAIDTFGGPAKANLTEALTALTLNLRTRGGRVRSCEEIQTKFQRSGLESVQFTFLPASQANFGMAVGTRP
jgi:ubiquinone/menaquinone biosynthesis C-methylase UbiE